MEAKTAWITVYVAMAVAVIVNEQIKIWSALSLVVAGIVLIVEHDKMAKFWVDYYNRYWSSKKWFPFSRFFVVPPWVVRWYSWGMVFGGVVFLLGAYVTLFGTIRT